MRYQGTIISWKEDRGFGFIRPLNNEADVFAHISAFRERNRAPAPNDKVIYELSLNNKGKYEAKNITYWEGYATEAQRPAKPLKLEIVGAPAVAATSAQLARKTPSNSPRNPSRKPTAATAKSSPRTARRPSSAPAQSFQNKPRRGKDPFFETAMALMIFIGLESVFFTFLLLNIGAKTIPGFMFVIYLVMSFFTYQMYVHDKKAARAGRWRTRERTLHTMSLFCGWPGALLVQYIERHKVVKSEFQIVFWLTVFGNCLVLLLAFPKSLPYIVQAVARVL